MSKKKKKATPAAKPKEEALKITAPEGGDDSKSSNDEGSSGKASDADNANTADTNAADTKKAKQSAKKDNDDKKDKATSKIPCIVVQAKRDGFRRAGLAFSAKQPNVLPLKDLTDKQLTAIRNEPMLVVLEDDA